MQVTLNVTINDMLTNALAEEYGIEPEELTATQVVTWLEGKIAKAKLTAVTKHVEKHRWLPQAKDA